MVRSSTRLMLGLVAVVMLGAGGALLIWKPDDPTAGVLIRVGLILGAGWLVAPMIRRPGTATVAVLAAGALVLVRPRLIVAVLVAALIWRFGRRRPG